MPAGKVNGVVAQEPALRQLASDIVARARFAERLGKTFDGRRDPYVALGYKRELTVADYRERYERGGIAKALIELMPRETWSSDGFDLVEDPDPGVSTDFEQAFAALADRIGLWPRLLRADIAAGLGRYSAILIGVAEPAPGGDLLAPLPQLRGPDDVLYLKVLAEDRAPIHSLVKDPADPRFGLPEYYTLQLGTEQSGLLPGPATASSLLARKVHWSRIVHVAEGLLEDDVYGAPRLRAAWNYLDDLQKIAGGGAEATWKRLHPRTLFDVDPELGDLNQDDEDELVNAIEEIVHDLKEHAVTRGVTPHVMSHTVQSFGPNADATLDLICATQRYPKRIFLGSERGELASTQDRNNFSQGPVDSRRQEFAAPLVRTFVDRLIEHGAIPRPAEYEVVLPALDELPESEQADIVAKFAEANRANVAAGGGMVVTANEMRDGVLSLSPIEEIADTGTQALDAPGAGNADPGLSVNRSLRAAKIRLCAARGIQFRAAEFDLADTPAEEPEWKSVHRAADAHRESLSRSVLGAWGDGGDAIDGEALQVAIVGVDAARLSEALAAGLAGISPDSEDEAAARRTAIDDALAAGRAERAVSLASGGVTAAEDRLAEILPDRLLATLVDGGLAALRSARSRGSWFRGAGAGVRGLETLSISFDAVNPRAVTWAADRSSALITEIGAETLAAVRELIALGIAEGIPPRKLVQQIRQAVGLRSDQLRAVENLRARMAAADPGDLVKAGRTRIRIPPEGATEALIDKRAGEYAQRLRQQRALLIARTETMTASNRGQKELWLQGQDSGQLPTDIEREWIVTPDDRLRPEHAAIAGQRRKLDEPFQTAEGRQLEPGEDPACRCCAGLVRPQRARASA